MNTAAKASPPPPPRRALADRLPVLKTFRKLARVRTMLQEERAALAEARGEVTRLRSLGKQITSLERVAAALLQDRGLHLLPPLELRTHVGRTEDAANFYYQGLHSSVRVVEVFGEEPGGLVLDWGCGSGRTLQWLHARPAWRDAYRGCDVDAEAVAWVRSRGVDPVSVCQDLPPLPYEDGAFVGLFCFSVLTHIPPDRHGDWYREIHRVLAPGGRAYLTVHSDSVMDAGKSFTPEEREAYARTGQCWSERDGHYKHAAVVSRTFSLGLLETLFEIEDYAPQGYHLMDAITVRKRPAP